MAANDHNQCEFIGRLGRDPETRYMTNGDAVTNFSIACGWKTKDKEGTEWVPVVTYGKLAEICGEYLKKGMQVFIQGRFRTRKWQEKDTGKDRYTTEIHADRMQMLGGKSGGDVETTESQEPSRSAPAARPAAPASKGNFDNFDDDIPFFDPYKFNWRIV